MNIDISYTEALGRASLRLQKKMQHSVKLLQKAQGIALAYDQRGGYYLAFSGGKDSQALFHIAQLAGVTFKAHMNLTSVDPPEVIRFVKRHYPEVELIKPKKSIYDLAVEKQILPSMRVRWCCAEYKEMSGAGKVTLIGIRHQESSRRAKRNEVEISSRKFSGTFEGFEDYRTELLQKKHANKHKQAQTSVNITNATEERTLGCIGGKESLLVSPIIHWTEDDVWEFLTKVVQVPHCELYDQGFHRIGCIGCPMSNIRQKIRENERWPHVKRNWIRAIMRIRAGGGIIRQTYSRPRQNSEGAELLQNTGYIAHPDPAHWMAQKREYRTVGGFSDSSSSNGLTEERELEIAENIYDWWISGRSYKKWYADKFLQLKLFED